MSVQILVFKRCCYVKCFYLCWYTPWYCKISRWHAWFNIHSV